MSEEELLVDRDKYLKHGVHIGTKSKHTDMEPYIFHVKKNQLAVLDLNTTDEKIREVGNFLSEYDPNEILVVGRKELARKPINAFSEALGTKLIAGRFMPGTLTNPESDDFMEPEVVIVTDPEEDFQAIKEAAQSNIPVVAIADSGNELENIDHVIPGNNKAENSIGLIYYLLAEQVKEARGDDFDYELIDFRPELEMEDEEE
ncbi:MAG: 30S ribosomal protein S2 [Nanohaloarchaea archaeon]|nr:30S ribosomal protein S2 [Candidatus Nanohaloarchaea archaeon]